jgi:hypothetical protein
MAPYALGPAEKDPLMVAALGELTRLHAERCAPYRRILDGAFEGWERAARTCDMPWLPVGIFKSHDLRSVPEADVFKIVASSGTTTGSPSRVALDRDTAARQTRVLLRLLGAFVGTARLPMLVVDHAPSGGHSIGARYAATVGVMPLGRDVLFCLDEDLHLRRDALREWLDKHGKGPLLVFGFTFVFWKHFLGELGTGEVDLSNATFLHTGGWKKLEAERVDNAAYKRACKERTGLVRVHDFYGMAEQVGTVFIECEHGFLHAPAQAEIVVRDERTWEPVPPGGTGVIECLSVLPVSYPGHALLTEDLGRLVALDGCACGRRGTHFCVIGRAPRAELRGCSDTRP